MSPSWNFPARAEPSYKGSEPSRAGASQFSSWKRAGDFSRFLDFLAQFFLSYFRCLAFLSQIFYALLLNERNQTFLRKKSIIHYKERWKESDRSSKNAKEIRKKKWVAKKKLLELKKPIPSWRKKATSRAELKTLSSSYGLSQLGLGSSL
jgi:hypothetical protein